MPRTLEVVLLVLLQPLTLILLAGMAGLLVRHWLPRLIALAVLLLGYATATPIGAAWLEHSLESRYAERPPEAHAEHQAIVLLGGGVGIDPRRKGVFDLTDAADRVHHAAALWHAGRAPVIIATGGTADRHDWSQAHAMRDVLEDLGVPREAVRLEAASRNTREHPPYVAPMLEDRDAPVLLVTSAFHMPRAVATFRAAGLAVTPAPTDFALAVGGGWHVWAPDTRALERSTRALKERLGLLHLRLRGKLRSAGLLRAGAPAAGALAADEG